MGVYRVDTGYVDEAGLIVAQGEHVELTDEDAYRGVAAGFLSQLAVFDDFADPAGLLADDPEPPKPKRRRR